VGRLINKVTLSLYDHAADGVVVQTRRAGRTAASAGLLLCGNCGAMPALTRLTLVAVLPA
jgi:hypothetical protein